MCLKFNEIDKLNNMVKQQLMSVSKICKDNKADIEKYKKEYVDFRNKNSGATKLKHYLTEKQRTQRLQKAEKREERHRAMRQGVSDMMHDQMRLIEAIQTNLKAIHAENDKMKFENLLQKKINGVEYFSKILIQQEQDFTKIL